MEVNGLIKFLETKRSKEELKICLDILQEFKANETTEEWMHFTFGSWERLEQFEDYLRLLTDTEVEEVDDKTAIEFLQNLKSE